jgi:tRNA G18 (ribose-2'-O)-methylase SpoU
MDRKEFIEQTRATYWNVHDDLKDKTLPELQKICKNDQLPFAVCALNVTGDLNLGMMMRTASLFGAERFIIYGRHNYDSRTTVGAQNYIEVVKSGSINHGELELDLSEFWHTMTDYCYLPIFFDNDGTSLYDFDFNVIDTFNEWYGMRPDGSQYNQYKPCLVFGNEGMGIPEELKKDRYVLTIPQRGVLRSLNVSAAASIAINHFSQYYSKK